ncbi:MAG: hypothetical protein ACFBWO_02705 [Paracoccaceae bacterium]
MKTDIGEMPWVPADGDIAVSRAALEGPDVWIEEGLRNAFFLSARAGEALGDVDLAGAFMLVRCTLA